MNPLSTPLVPPLSTPLLPLLSAHVPPPSVRSSCTAMPYTIVDVSIRFKSWSRHVPPGAQWSDYSKEVGGQFIWIRLKIAKKCGLYLDIFSCVKMKFFARFSLSCSRCMSDAITSTKLEPTGKIFWDSRCCLCAWVSAFWARRIKEKWEVTLCMCWL